VPTPTNHACVGEPMARAACAGACAKATRARWAARAHVRSNTGKGGRDGAGRGGGRQPRAENLLGCTEGRARAGARVKRVRAITHLTVW